MPDKISLLLIPVFFLCLLGLPLPEVNASPVPVPEQQVEKIQDIYRELTSLSFDFSQLTRTGGRARQGAGTAVLFRPKNNPSVMRWNYTEPDTQIILNDGSKLSIYTKQDNQVIITSAEELQSDITYAFFAGTRNLLDDFTANPPENRFIFSTGDQDMQSVKLVPKEPHAQIKALHLWFDKDFLIRRLVMEDHFDSITELSFSNIKLNSLPADSPDTLKKLLQIDLPPGTEVISQ
jgi:outer membrane lipoprotein carrier protein